VSSVYNAENRNRLDVGLEGAVKGGKSLLVPFLDQHYAMMYVSGLAGPLFPPKMEFNVVQFRMEINVYRRRMSSQFRPIHIPASVRVGYPQIELVSLEPSNDLVLKMFWDSLIEASMHAFQCDEFIFFGNNMPRRIFGFGTDTGFVQFEAVSEKRIGAALHEICTGKRLTAMVPVSENPGVYVALVRLRDTAVSASSIRFVYNEGRFSHRRFIFPSGLHETYPGIQFLSEHSTNAYMHALVQQPIKDYHWTLWKEVEEEFYFHPRLTALAMSFHPRLGNEAPINRLSKDNLIAIARITCNDQQA
jgi:hypothetical protein